MTPREVFNVAKTSTQSGPNKALIIAEKPSVAADIARALGGFTKHEDYFESDEFVVSSAVGHLLEIAAPDAYEVKRGKWSFANLRSVKAVDQEIDDVPLPAERYDPVPFRAATGRLRLPSTESLLDKGNS